MISGVMVLHTIELLLIFGGEQEHNTIIFIKNNQNDICAKSMAKAILVNNSRKFWTGVKKKCNGKNISTLNVDNSIGKEKICDLFCDKYKKLYKSVPYDKEEMKSLCNIIDTNVVSNCVGGRCYNKHTVTIDDVCQNIRKLKNNIFL